MLLDPVLFSPAMMLGAAVAILTGTARLSPLARSARSRRHHWASRDEAFDQLRHRGVSQDLDARGPARLRAPRPEDAPDGGVELKCQPSREAEVFASAPERLWTLLGRIETPTLVVHADHTLPFVLEGAARLRRVNRHVQTQEVSGTHCFMQEAAGQHRRAGQVVVAVGLRAVGINTGTGSTTMLDKRPARIL